MRSTRATAAVERLKRRSGDDGYAMVRTGDERFYLVRKDATTSEPLCAGLPLDEFVAFVNGYGPQQMRRVTQADAAFEKQLLKK